MISKYLESISVCCLSLKGEMSNSSQVKRRSRESVLRKCRRSTPPKRQPLKCQKNVIHSSNSIQDSTKKYKKTNSENDIIRLTTQTAFLQSPKRLRSSSRKRLTLQSENSTATDKNVSEYKDKLRKSISTVEIDELSINARQSTKRSFRSSSRTSITLKSKDIEADKNVFEYSPQGFQNKSGKNTFEGCPLIQQKSPNKTKRQSFYRCDIASQCSQKPDSRKSCSDIITEMTKTVSPESPREIVRSSRCSMTLRSARHSEKISNNVQLSSQYSQKCNSRKSSRGIITEVPKTVSRESPKETVRSSRRSMTLRSVRHSEKISSNMELSSQCTQKHCRKSSRGIGTEIPKAVSPELPKETVRSSRSSMTLRSVQNSEKMSNMAQLSSAPEIKQVRKSVSASKKRKLNAKNTKDVKSPYKSLSSALSKSKTLVQKHSKRSLEKSRTRVRSKSYGVNIPIDDLALTPLPGRKAKSDGFKLPGKKSLKRKRFIISEMKKADEDYEDDIYESKKFDHFKNIFPDSSESEMSWAVRTPQLAFSLTPVIRSKTPVYRDCFSPTEYALSRKIAEECMYKNKKKKSMSKAETPNVPEKKKLEFNKVMEDAYAFQKKVEKLTEEPSDEEDIYFTDIDS